MHALLIAVMVFGAGVAFAAPADTDGDGISDAHEGIDTKRDTDTDGQPDFQDLDADGDGIADAIEAGDTDLDTPPRDTDSDGLPDYQDVDSDNDMLPDAVEDPDGDGVVDPDETDPLKGDSDEDGVSDGEEDKNRNGQVDAGEPDPRSDDSDRDGLLDGKDSCPVEPEDKDGLLDNDGCPEVDADGDGIADAVELGHRCLEPLKRDSDADGLADGVEDRDRDGAVDKGESDPCDRDSDDDGLLDGEDSCPVDPEDFDGYRDRDGCPDPGDRPDGGPWEWPDGGVFDGWRWDFVPDAATSDRDGDGIVDLVEQDHSCLNPDNPDTDGDGRMDGAEDLNKNGRFEPQAGERNPCVADVDPMGGGGCALVGLSRSERVAWARVSAPTTLGLALVFIAWLWNRRRRQVHR